MRRSYLYVPGDRPDRMAKAVRSGAHGVILDLEDGVAFSAKDTAREAVARFLADATSHDAASNGAARTTALLVRCNADALERDIEAIGDLPVEAICLAKATSERLEELDALLGGRSTGVVALIESAVGLLDAPAIARHPRVRNLAIGEADLTAELGLAPSDDERELWPLRSALVVASAAASIDPPTGPVSTEFRNLAAFGASTALLRRAGFGARSCIHPDQVAVVNQVFTPSVDEVGAARALIEAFEASVERGAGVFVGPDGRMVDEAVVRAARRVLDD